MRNSLWLVERYTKVHGDTHHGSVKRVIDNIKSNLIHAGDFSTIHGWLTRHNRY